jgi:hypothetical protein
LLAILFAGLGGCGEGDRGPTAIVCAGVADVSIYVGVIDARTGLPAARGATLSAIGTHRLAAGPYVDTTAGGAISDSLMVVAAFPGSYSVIVRKSRYSDWSASLTVADDALCTHHDSSLEAPLQPHP